MTEKSKKKTGKGQVSFVIYIYMEKKSLKMSYVSALFVCGERQIVGGGIFNEAIYKKSF
jgi:hypothetical protein